MSIDKTLFDRLGGKSTLLKVHHLFYERVYAHPWLSKYFTERPREFLESQQTDFMGMLMGGPKIFGGKLPKLAHQHMMITEELFDLRSQLLSDSIKEAGIDDSLREEWIEVDATFRRAIIKSSPSECSTTRPNQVIMNHSN